MALLLGWPTVVFAQENVTSGTTLDTLQVTASRITCPLPRAALHL
jgi:hypothetical protein